MYKGWGWLSDRAMDLWWKGLVLSPGRSCGRIFFSRVIFLCWPLCLPSPSSACLILKIAPSPPPARYNHNGWLGVKHQGTYLSPLPNPTSPFPLHTHIQHSSISTPADFVKTDFLSLRCTSPQKLTVIFNVLKLVSYLYMEEEEGHCVFGKGWWQANM